MRKAVSSFLHLDNALSVLGSTAAADDWLIANYTGTLLWLPVTMTDSPNWIVWLLVGLAILPMAIPVYRRYQVVRLRLTAPRVRGLMTDVPARLPFSRSLYLAPKGMTALHLERGGKSRIWFGLITSSLIMFPLLIVLTGIVYHRIAVENFNPPYFSILVRPGGAWHHVEFMISPWTKFFGQPCCV